MLELILEISGFAFILLCTVKLIYFVSYKALSYGTDNKALLVLPCSKGKNCAGLISAMLIRLPLFTGINTTIVAVDCGMSDKEKQACTEICCEYGNVLLCSPDELPQILTEEETSDRN